MTSRERISLVILPDQKVGYPSSFIKLQKPRHFFFGGKISERGVKLVEWLKHLYLIIKKFIILNIIISIYDNYSEFITNIKLFHYLVYCGWTRIFNIKAVVLWLSDSPRDGELTVVRLSPLSGSSDYRLGKNSPISYKKVTMSPNENNRSCETASVITGWWNSFFVKYQ